MTHVRLGHWVGANPTLSLTPQFSLHPPLPGSHYFRRGVITDLERFDSQKLRVPWGCHIVSAVLWGTRAGLLAPSAPGHAPSGRAILGQEEQMVRHGELLGKEQAGRVAVGSPGDLVGWH